jgi:hypothetical protein
VEQGREWRQKENREKEEKRRRGERGGGLEKVVW